MKLINWNLNIFLDRTWRHRSFVGKTQNGRSYSKSKWDRCDVCYASGGSHGVIKAMRGNCSYLSARSIASWLPSRFLVLFVRLVLKWFSIKLHYNTKPFILNLNNSKLCFKIAYNFQSLSFSTLIYIEPPLYSNTRTIYFFSQFTNAITYAAIALRSGFDCHRGKV